MKVLNNIFAGLKHRRLITTVYLIQFVLAVTVGLQVYSVIDASIGHSLSLEGLRLGNAHMVINDLLNVHGASLSPILGQVRWLVVAYLIIAAFIHAGIWYSLIHEGGKTDFWTGGATYFFRCLIIGMVMMVLFMLFSAILWLPYFSNLQKWMELWPSEAPILWLGIGIFIVWSLCAVYFFLASSFAKIILIRDHQSVVKSLLLGFKTAVRRLFKLFPTLLVFLVVFVIIYLSHGVIDDLPVLTSTLGILILFVIQQLLVWMKIGLRVSVYKYLLSKV